MALSVLGSLSEWLFLCRHRGFGGGSASTKSAPQPAEKPAPRRIKLAGECVKFAVDEGAQIVPILRSASSATKKLRLKSVTPRWIRLQAGADQRSVSIGNTQPTQ